MATRCFWSSSARRWRRAPRACRRTSRSLIASRLDSLDLQARSVLEAAAIVGRDFWPGALSPLLDDVGTRGAGGGARAPRDARVRRRRRVGSDGGADRPLGALQRRAAAFPARPRARQRSPPCPRRAGRSCTSASPPASARLPARTGPRGLPPRAGGELRIELRPRHAPPAVAAVAPTGSSRPVSAPSITMTPAARPPVRRARALLPSASPDRRGSTRRSIARSLPARTNG